LLERWLLEERIERIFWESQSCAGSKQWTKRVTWGSCWERLRQRYCMARELVRAPNKQFCNRYCWIRPARHTYVDKWRWRLLVGTLWFDETLRDSSSEADRTLSLHNCRWTFCKFGIWLLQRFS
jgi:hypothetical protein